MPEYIYEDYEGVPYSANSIPVTGDYLYTEIDRRFWYYQPNLVRWRHRYRGVRESIKLNQEITQTTFDIYNINQKKNSLLKTTNLYFDYAMEGWDLDDNIEYNWAYDDEGSDQPAEMIGLNELITRVEALRQRVRSLEA